MAERARSVLHATVALWVPVALTMMASFASLTMVTSLPASYVQVHHDGIRARQSGVSAEDPEQLPTFAGDGVAVGVTAGAVVALAVGSAVQTDAPVVLGVEVIAQTATPSPITATKTTAITPNSTGTRS